MPLAQGDLLNKRYRIFEVLGHGGMGSVYRAHDESLGVDVAVKENLFTTEDYANQFRLEANILARLRHPNLPRVSDHFVLPDEGQYLVMDYIEGPDLRQILEKSGPISEQEAIRIGAAICDALDFLHTRQPAVLHRDIKLGNIKLVPDGHICLVDFGLAKVVQGDQPTMTGARAMTPGYSPPEQYGSARTDARSDIYSLGATLYAAITGFIAEDSIMRALEGLELTPVRKRVPNISERLALVIEKAMQVSPENRYQSASEFKQALLGETQPPSPGEPASYPQPAPPPVSEPAPAPKRAPFRPLLLLGTLFLLGLSGIFYFNPGIFSPQPALSVSPTDTSAVLSQPVPASASPTPPPPTITPTLAPTQTSTATTVPPTEVPPPLSTIVAAGPIAFVSLREDNKAQIYTMNPDGSQQERLFLDTDGACQPKWSPDGLKLAFISPCDGRLNEYPNASIGIFDLVTGQTQTIPSQLGGDFDPSWSPDGLFLAFTSIRSNDSLQPLVQIYKVDLQDEKRAVTRLTQTGSTEPARQPAWSRDGERILYSLRIRGIWRIWSMSADGENHQQLFHAGGGVSDIHPAWAFDNRSILFTQFRSNLDTLPYLGFYNLETAGTEIFYEPSKLPLRDAVPSPDGLFVLAEGNDGNNIDIYLLNLQTRETTRLTTDPGIDFDADWRP
jgi:eukaryotic-like serine/threonine-protein kinase